MWWIAWVAVAAAEPLTLQDAIHEALSSNLELKRAGLAVGISELSLVRARSAFEPQLSVSASTSASNSPNNDTNVGQSILSLSSSSVSASVSQRLPTGGSATLSVSENRSTTNALDAFEPLVFGNRASISLSQPLLRGFGPAALWGLAGARLNVTRAQLDWRANVEQSVIDISTAYWRLVSAERSYQLALQSRALAERSVEETQERFDEGFAGSGDLLQVQRALGSAKQAEVISEAEREAANNALCRLLGRDVLNAPLLEPSDAPGVPTSLPAFDVVLTQARTSNADFLRQQLDAEQAELRVKDLRNQALPDLSVNGNLGLSGQANTAPLSRLWVLSGGLNAWSVSATMSVPLAGRSLHANRQQAKLDARSAELTLEAAEQDLVLRVQQALRSVERDLLQVELATETLRVAELALEADQERLRDGRGSTRDVVMSSEARDQAAAGRLRAQIGLQRSLLELKRVAGTLMGPGELPTP